MSSLSVCKAADPNRCRYHNRRSTVVEALEQAQRNQDFEGYFLLRKELEELDSTISVMESESSLKNATQWVSDQQGKKDLYKEQVQRIHKTGEYEGVAWQSYAQLATNLFTPQSYGGLLEKMYIEKLGYMKVPASDECGDFLNVKDASYSEFKVSGIENGSQVNIVQIRPHHDIDNYHIVVVDKKTGDSMLFVLTKDEMTEELEATGSALAHGTRAGNKNTHKEYAIRFPAKDSNAVFARWKQKYLKTFPNI